MSSVCACLCVFLHTVFFSNLCVYWEFVLGVIVLKMVLLECVGRLGGNVGKLNTRTSCYLRLIECTVPCVCTAMGCKDPLNKIESHQALLKAAMQNSAKSSPLIFHCSLDVAKPLPSSFRFSRAVALIIQALQHTIALTSRFETQCSSVWNEIVLWGHFMGTFTGA